MHRRRDREVTSSKEPTNRAISIGSSRSLVPGGADVVVEGGVRAWCILDRLAGDAEAFDGGSLVAGSEGSACTVVSWSETDEKYDSEGTHPL